MIRRRIVTTVTGVGLTARLLARAAAARRYREINTRTLSRRLLAGSLVLVLVGAACGSSSTPSTTAATVGTTSPAPSTTAATVGTTSTSTIEGGVDPSNSYALGAFPDYPEGPLPDSVTTALQSQLDTAVEKGTFEGVTAAVIVADKGNWTGTSGTWEGAPITPDSRHPTHSSAKTFIAAQVLRLVEDGKIGLDDPAADHLPPELAFFDANGATIRDALGMRSGLTSLDEAYYVAELAATVVDAFKALPAPAASPGSVTSYSGTNYVLLGSIIEHIAGRPLAEALQTDVLAHPGLDGIVYTVSDALASDGWGVEATSASLARWGYNLYGGFVISDTSLQEMTDFRGEWYGLGVMDYSRASGEFHEFAIGHQGLSSVTTCCSGVALVALPDRGIVIAVQATTPTEGDLNPLVDRLASLLAATVKD